MIATVKFKIDNKVYNTTIKFTDYDEILIDIKSIKGLVIEKLISNAYSFGRIDDFAYHNAIKNTIINGIEIVSVTIPNCNKTE